MAVLPFSQEKQTDQPLPSSQIGDYAMMLSRKSSLTTQPLLKRSCKISSMERYAGILTDAGWGNTGPPSVAKGLGGKTESLLNNVDEDRFPPLLRRQLDEVAKEFSEFPLLYDGPFSDHILRREALFCAGKRNAAGEVAALHCKPEELEALGTGGSAIEAYVFLLRFRIQVTRPWAESHAYFKKCGV